MKPGLVVESVAVNSEGEKAGLAKGDILLGWLRGDSQGKIESPFDLSKIEAEQEPLGRVTLVGLRAKLKKEWPMGPDKWDMQARPDLPPALLAIYREGLRLAGAGKLDDAAARWRQAANDSASLQCSWLGAWFLFRAAQALADRQQWKASDELSKEAIESTPAEDTEVMLQLLLSRAGALRLSGDADGAAKAYQLALDDAQRAGHEDRATGESLTGLGLVAWHRGDLDRAEDYLRQALAIRQRLVPGSLAEARAMNNLGIVECLRGDLAQCEQYNSNALEIQRKLAPGGLDMAASLNTLGNIADQRKDLLKAEEFHRQSLEIQERLEPGSLDVAKSLNGIGIVEIDRGDLAKAEEYIRRALVLFEKFQPGSRTMAATLNNLGDVAEHRGELAEAEKYFEQSLTLCETIEPGSADVAELLNNLGTVALMTGDLARSEGFFERALAIVEQRAPGSLDMAEMLSNLGGVASGRQELDKAAGYYNRALEIQTKLAPASASRAEWLAESAGIARKQMRMKDAAQLYAQAIDVLESQVALLGGSSDVRAEFRAKHAGYYAAYSDLLLEQKQPELAFEILERSRARTLLEMLAESHLNIREGADPTLLEQQQKLQAALAAKTKERVDLLQGKHTEVQAAAAGKEIDGLLSQYRDVEEQIRSSNPRYAALTQPQTLSAADVRRQLIDADTVLLEYSLGEERSLLFVLTRGSLDSYELPKRSVIEDAAHGVYGLLTSRNRWIEGESDAQRAARLAKNDADYGRAIGALSQVILGPAAAQLKEKRLLIVADGALQYIPFAVLPDPSADALKPTDPLVAGHEIVNLPSASALALLRRQAESRPAAPMEVAVLADPVFDREDARVKRMSQSIRAGELSSGNETIPEGLSHSLRDVGQGASLARLTLSRKEADAIVSMAEPGKCLEAVDFAASRATALSKELGQYRMAHFATHGLLDNEHPELSGLVLSLVDRDGRPQDGFLDLEDVYNLTLPADLVVLSACETGLGKQVSGEGLVGLTRGFMYAGASRVVASLWKVDDAATADLMERFYRGMLKDKRTPAAALRQAQLEVRSQKRWSDPFYWAAFTLQGEWK
jgi:CHAT domain-containing protein/Tfp pilus assembly protein PilF